MTNQTKIALVLGVMCLALTAGICLQIRTVKSTNTTVSQSYTENNLRAEVLRYKEKYDNRMKELEKLESDLEIARKEATQNNAELEKAEEDIKQGNKMIGLTEVTGPGVIITVKDSDVDTSTVFNSSSLLVHDKDVLGIVNELKNLGAEAISVNEQRIIPTTSIICGGGIINLNGERIGSPFVIKAIGLPENLANIERPDGYLGILKSYSIITSLKKSNSITIPKYTGTITYKHLQKAD